jgi:hypothetical protein
MQVPGAATHQTGRRTVAQHGNLPHPLVLGAVGKRQGAV